MRSINGNYSTFSLADSTIFSGNDEKRFAITTLNPHSHASNESTLPYAYHKFRADVYIDQLGILDDGARTMDGVELDEDDERAQHFIVVENKLGSAALIACMRLITKEEEAGLLPVESVFSDIHRDAPAEVGSVEVSRFITRHDNSSERAEARTMMLASALAYVDHHNLGPAYAIIEPELERHLLAIGVPLERLSEYRWLNEYGSDNASVRIDTLEMTRRFGGEAVGRSLLLEEEWKFWGSHGVDLMRPGMETV